MSPSPDEQRQIDVSERILTRIPQRPVDYKDPTPRPLGPIPGTRLGAILVQGAGSTSDPRDRTNFFMNGLVSDLGQLRVPYEMFGYKGPNDLNYGPWDTRVNIASKARDLTEYVSAFPDGKLALIGHSQGGNLIAYWACNYAAPAELERLAGVFIISSPLRLPEPPQVWENREKDRYQLWLNAIDGYSVNLPTLSHLLRQQLMIFRCWHDLLAPPHSSSFMHLPRSAAPIAEIVIRDTTHSQICDHTITRTIITRYVMQFP